MSTLEEKITPILDDLEGTIENKLFYATLSLTLTLPDICSSLSNGGKTTGKKYSEWVGKYFIPLHEYDVINPGDVYGLRCAFLHNGMDDISTQRMRETLNKVTFLNTYREIRFHNVKKTIQTKNSDTDEISEYVSTILNTDTFALQMIQSVKSFIKENENNKRINKEAENMMSFEDDRNGFGF